MHCNTNRLGGQYFSANAFAKRKAFAYIVNYWIGARSDAERRALRRRRRDRAPGLSARRGAALAGGSHATREESQLTAPGVCRVEGATGTRQSKTELTKEAGTSVPAFSYLSFTLIVTINSNIFFRDFPK